MKNDKTEQWYQRRRQGIGGSDVASIVYKSPWKTQYQLWLEKTGRDTEQQDNNSLWLGSALEDPIAGLYTKVTGRRVVRYNSLLMRGICIGNIDRLIIPDGEKVASVKQDIRTDSFLEIKYSGTPVWDEVPIQYVLQVTHYFGLCDKFQHADLACFFTLPRELKIYRFERDQVAIDALQEVCQRWWDNYVVKDTPPPLTGIADARLMYPFSKSKAIEGGSLIEDVMRYAQLTKAKKVLDNEQDAIKDKLSVFMGENDTLTDQNGQAIITYKSNKEKEVIDWESIAREYNPPEEQIQKHTTVKPGVRVFRVNTSFAKQIENEGVEKCQLN